MRRRFRGGWTLSSSFSSPPSPFFPSCSEGKKVPPWLYRCIDVVISLYVRLGLKVGDVFSFNIYPVKPHSSCEYPSALLKLSSIQFENSVYVYQLRDLRHSQQTVCSAAIHMQLRFHLPLVMICKEVRRHLRFRTTVCGEEGFQTERLPALQWISCVHLCRN